MRQILVDYARRKNYAKRGGGAIHVSLTNADSKMMEPAAEVRALDEALTRLEKLDSRQARVVELRFFGGLTIKETAEAMGISVDTVKREWSTAKACDTARLVQDVNRGVRHPVKLLSRIGRVSKAIGVDHAVAKVGQQRESDRAAPVGGDLFFKFFAVF